MSPAGTQDPKKGEGMSREQNTRGWSQSPRSGVLLTANVSV